MATALSTDTQPTLTTGEVKDLLREIAFVIRLSRGIKLEILAGARHTARPVESAAHNAMPPVCAA
jgi:hypothetical protein